MSERSFPQRPGTISPGVGQFTPGLTSEVVSGSILSEAVGYKGSSQAEFGVYGENNTAIGFDDKMMGRHILYLGGIGTGKTVGIKELLKSVRSAMTEDDCMVFFDTKGDYIEEFYREGDVSLSSAKLGTYQGQRVWNVFSEFQLEDDSASVEDQIFEICGGLFAGLVDNSGNNAYFANGARDLFTSLVTALAREKSKEYTNKDIRLIISSMSIAEMREALDREGNEDLLGVKNYIARDTSNSALALLAFMQQVIQESFRSSFGEAGDFSIRDFIREKGGKALFFEYDISSGNTLGPIFKTMIDTSIKEALSRNRSAGRVFFVLDEFALLPELKHLTDGLNFGRSLGLRFIVGTQNVRQVKAMYGDHIAASVLSAFGSVFSFRLFDGFSRDFVRDRFGRNQKIIRFDSKSKAGGIHEMLDEGYVVEDWDLSALPVGMCIASPPGEPPFKFAFQIQPVAKKFDVAQPLI